MEVPTFIVRFLVKLENSLRIPPLLLCLLLSIGVVYAQIPSGDLSTFNLEQLGTDAPQRIYESFQRSGLNESQFFESLTSRGLPVTELQKLKVYFQKLQSTKGIAAGRFSGKQGVNTTTPTQDELLGNTESKNKLIEQRLFGFKMFTSDQTGGFEPNMNMATPKDYVVGPGDELVLQIYGVAQKKYETKVTNEGKITLDDIGVIHVDGFTIDALQSMLTAKLSLRYSGMSGKSPNTFLQISVTNIRTIKVNVLGEVNRPGTYSLPSYVNVFNALYSAGGPNFRGTFRNIQVFRSSKQIALVDLYDLLVNGKTSQNIRLEDNDVILVGPSVGRVDLTGEIRIPGLFELKPKETFQDLLKFSGGFTDKAYRKLVNVRRRGTFENESFDLPEGSFETGLLKDGDSITVSQILERFRNRVQITGAVIRPGAYELMPGMRVTDLIEKSGGLKGDAFLSRALLYRTKSDYTQESLSIDISQSSKSSFDHNPLLQREDLLSIPAVSDLRQEFYVQISGEVNSPGAYPFVQNMSVADLILQSGGFKYSAYSSEIEVARREPNDLSRIAEIFKVSVDSGLVVGSSDINFILSPFDHVFIRNKPGFQVPKTVSIRGEVMYPGLYVIDKKEMRISDLIKRSGGPTKYAYIKGASLLRKRPDSDKVPEAEQEKILLNEIRSNISKNAQYSTADASLELDKRLKSKISELDKIAEAEKLKEKEKEREKEIISGAGSLQQSQGVKKSNLEDQELVAADFEKILRSPGSTEDIFLKEGDVITIPEFLETVSVQGGVLYPVSVKYKKSMSFKKYVSRAGGYAPRINRNRSYVVQANGEVDRVRNYLVLRDYPRVLPGAKIVVPDAIVQRNGFSFERGLGIITSSLTLLFLLRSL